MTHCPVLTPRVLIVDDSITVRMDLKESFEASGFSVVMFATAGAAREWLTKEKCALIVLDVLLPDQDGLEFLRELKLSPGTAKTPIMLLTSEDEVKHRILGLKLGADEYIGKPYDWSQVLNRAKKLVQAPLSGPRARPLVLIIDDSLTYRQAIQKTLESNGYDVATAAAGKEGLRMTADLRPDAVIVDQNLPGIDGALVVKKIRMDSALRRTPCLLVTASEDKGEELRALDGGADDFASKREKPGVVLAKVAALLRTGRARAAESPTESLLSPKRILAVDDSKTYLQGLADHLREEGYDMVLAASGEEALELLSVQPVDAILLDLLMPGLSGKETCRKIKSAAALRDIPLIMLTALEEKEAMIEGINAGADDCITKSGDFEVLKARLRAQLRKKQFEDENRHVRERLMRKEVEALEAQALRELSETRVSLIADLERQTGLFKSILDCLGEGVAVANEKGELTLFNPAAEKIVGLGPQKAVPEEWASRFGTYFPDRKTLFPGQEQPLARAVRGESTDDVEIFLRNAAIPEGVDVSVTGRPLVDGVGKSLGGAVVFRDITQKKKIDEELKALNRELEAFSYSVSHDLRAPLRHIGGFVELLIKKEAAGLSAEGRRYLGIVSEAAQKMGRLIDDLLHFSRVGRTELRREAVDLLILAHEVAEETEKEGAQRKIAWEIGTLPRVQGDPGLLRLVLVNLISNAVKYTGKQPAPRIELGTAAPQNGNAVLFVRDNGVGFDMKYVDKLFGVFQRLHANDDFPGTGIGLANVRRIVRRHGGDAWAEGAEGRGATFYFSLPLSEKG